MEHDWNDLRKCAPLCVWLQITTPIRPCPGQVSARSPVGQISEVRAGLQAMVWQNMRLRAELYSCGAGAGSDFHSMVALYVPDTCQSQGQVAPHGG